MVAVAAVVALVAAVPPVASAAALFASADASTVVMRGTVERITAYPSVKLQVFRLRVTRVFKGDGAAGGSLDLAQEMLFPSTKPFFTEGAETLVFAIPLPDYSSFREALPAGQYWRWSERLETATDVAPLADPALADAVGRYLAVRDDPEALADFAVGAIVGPHARVRRDVLTLIGSRREIPPLLDAGRLQPLVAWLRDASPPPAERGSVLVQLARHGAPGVVDLARGLADAPNPVQAPAIDALITMNAPPPPERLLALSRDRSEGLRLVATRGLAKLGTPAALDRLAEMLAQEVSLKVRVAILESIGRVENPRIVDLLRVELARPEKDVAMAAAEALVQQGNPGAVDVLAKGLEEGGQSARVASAFALRRMNRRDADEVLDRIEKTHPDPEVRRLCQLARGENMHRH